MSLFSFFFDWNSSFKGRSWLPIWLCVAPVVRPASFCSAHFCDVARPSPVWGRVWPHGVTRTSPPASRWGSPSISSAGDEAVPHSSTPSLPIIRPLIVAARPCEADRWWKRGDLSTWFIFICQVASLRVWRCVCVGGGDLCQSSQLGGAVLNGKRSWMGFTQGCCHGNNELWCCCGIVRRGRADKEQRDGGAGGRSNWRGATELNEWG